MPFDPAMSNQTYLVIIAAWLLFGYPERDRSVADYAFTVRSGLVWC